MGTVIAHTNVVFINLVLGGFCLQHFQKRGLAHGLSNIERSWQANTGRNRFTDEGFQRIYPNGFEHFG